jgi:hypothetical protein
LGELSDGLLKLLDVTLVSLFFVSNEGLDLLGDFLGDLLEVLPVLANLGVLFDLSVLNQFLGLKSFDGFIKLINLEGDGVFLRFDKLCVLHDFGKLFNILQVFLAVLSVDIGLIFTEVSGEHVNLGGNVILHNTTSHSVVLGITLCNDTSLVWTTSERDHFKLIVLEEDLNLNGSSLIRLILDSVFTIIRILNCSINLLGHDLSLVLNGCILRGVLFFLDFFLDLVFSGDLNLKDILTRDSVFFFVISSLDDEFDGRSSNNFVQNTGSVSKRLTSSGVEIETEVDIGGGDVSRAKG